MVNVSVARRYARALLDVAGESSRLEAVGEQLSTLADIVSGNAELAAVMADPAHPQDLRRRVVTQVMDVAGVTEPLLRNTVELLVDRNRLASVPDIARVYRTLSDARSGRLRGQLVSARPLDSEATRRIEQALEALTQRNVVLETHVDPEVLGGVAAHVGSVVYDGTLRTQLQEMRRNLVQS